MYVFLTSSPTGPLDGSRICEGLDRMNHFVENLTGVCKDTMRGLIIAAYKDHYEENNQMCDYFRNAFEVSGIHFSTFDLCDERYIFTKDEIQQYDLIVLGGGHVPTQNHFFQQIHLKECLEGYEGIVIGISAGSMNCAESVYVEPEEPGETRVDFVRELPGLAISQINLIPHYQMVKHNILDGKRLFEDVVYLDSYGKRIFLIDDGSYISNFEGNWKVYGNSYLLHNGICESFCHNDESRDV